MRIAKVTFDENGRRITIDSAEQDVRIEWEPADQTVYVRRDNGFGKIVPGSAVREMCQFGPE